MHDGRLPLLQKTTDNPLTVKPERVPGYRKEIVAALEADQPERNSFHCGSPTGRNAKLGVDARKVIIDIGFRTATDPGNIPGAFPDGAPLENLFLTSRQGNHPCSSQLARTVQSALQNDIFKNG